MNYIVDESLLNQKVTKGTVDYLRIYPYTELDGFKLNPNVNRAINLANVKRFKRMMKNGTYDPERGVAIVDIKTKTILDYQHRFESLKLAQKEFNYKEPMLVRYVDAPTKVEDLQNYIRSLQVSRKWSPEDYISANIGGKNDLNKLRDFCLNHPLLMNGDNVCWVRGAAIISREQSSVYRQKLKDRNCRFTKEEWANAETIYNEVEQIFDAMGEKGTGGSTDYIINAWKTIRYNIEYMDLLCKLPGGFKTFLQLLRDNRETKPTGQSLIPFVDYFLGLLKTKAVAA